MPSTRRQFQRNSQTDRDPPALRARELWSFSVTFEDDRMKTGRAEPDGEDLRKYDRSSKEANIKR